MSFLWHYGGIIRRHDRHLLVKTPIPHSQASDHRVTVGMTNNMLLIVTPLMETCWRNFIHSWRSWRCHGWRLCGTHIFPLFNSWRIQFKKYFSGGVTCAMWLSLPINYSSVSVLIFVESNAPLMPLTQAVCFYFGRSTIKEWVFISHPRQVLYSTNFPSPVSYLR